MGKENYNQHKQPDYPSINHILGLIQLLPHIHHQTWVFLELALASFFLYTSLQYNSLVWFLDHALPRNWQVHYKFSPFLHILSWHRSCSSNDEPDYNPEYNISQWWLFHSDPHWSFWKYLEVLHRLLLIPISRASTYSDLQHLLFQKFLLLYLH